MNNSKETRTDILTVVKFLMDASKNFLQHKFLIEMYYSKENIYKGLVNIFGGIYADCINIRNFNKQFKMISKIVLKLSTCRTSQ